MTNTAKAFALGLLLLSTPAAAGDSMDHGAMDAKGAHKMHDKMSDTAMPKSEASAAFAEVNAKMHKNMQMDFTGDADVDFIKGMIPHHQGAIEMAKVVLKYGKDPETRKLADEIIAAQEKEIAFMKDWLAKRGK